MKRFLKRTVNRRVISGSERKASRTAARPKRSGWLCASIVWQKAMKALAREASSPVMTRFITKDLYETLSDERIWVL